MRCVSLLRCFFCSVRLPCFATSSWAPVNSFLSAHCRTRPRKWTHVNTWNSMEEHAMWHAIDLFSHSLRTCWKLNPTASQKNGYIPKLRRARSVRTVRSTWWIRPVHWEFICTDSDHGLQVQWGTKNDQNWPKCSKYSIIYDTRITPDTRCG